MIKLHVEDFIHGEDLSCDIFMKQDDRFIKVSSGGERITSDIVASYRTAKLYSLYVRRSDFIEYLGLKNFCITSESSENKERIKTSFQFIFAGLTEIHSLNVDAVSRALSLFYTVLDVLCDHPEAFLLLEKLQEQKSRTFKLAAYSSLLAALVCQYTGRRSIREFFTLVTSSLFSGVGLLGTSLHNKNYKEGLTEDEKVILEAHPVRSSKIVSKLPLPEVISLIVLQHEEKEDGTGYPNNLKGHQILPLAKIVSATHSFVFKYLQDDFISTEDSIQKLEAFTVKSIHIYDIRVLEAMLQAFNLSTPLEFVEHQLTKILSAGDSI